MVKKEKGGSKFKQVFIYLLGVGGGRDGEYTMKDIKMGSGLVMRQFFNWSPEDCNDIKRTQKYNNYFFFSHSKPEKNQDFEIY